MPFLQFDVTISDLEADQMTTEIRDTVRKDRALYDKAQKAFVSWVRRLVMFTFPFLLVYAMTKIKDVYSGSLPVLVFLCSRVPFNPCLRC